MSAFQKPFFEYVKDSLYQYKDKSQIPYHDFYVQAYNLMDMFGISKDKLKGKNTFNNILNDAFHSYYAQYCDILITEDEGMIKKSKYLYNLYSSSRTQIISPEVAVRFLPYLAKNEIRDKDDFFQKLARDLNDGERENIDLIYEDGNVYYIRAYTKYFNYFNGILLFELQNGSVIIQLVKKHETILTYANYREIGTIVDKCISVFGLDDDRNGQFGFNREVEQIRNNQWNGRYWKINDRQAVTIAMSESLKQLTIGFGPI